MIRKVLPLPFVLLLLNWIGADAAEGEQFPLWDIALKNKDTFRFSTLFTAQNVRQHLSSEEGVDKAVRWCKETAVTKVFIESFRGGYRAERDALERARDGFRKEGIEASGCITTTRLGKKSVKGWDDICCYTDIPTQEKLQSEFEFAASMFDEIMIDDFLFTDCQCEECEKARGSRSWAEFRCELMLDVSNRRILSAAKKVNPKVKIIIKYPQWYDNFHERGYDVVRQTRDFDLIWVGTECRDPDNRRWGRKAQYESYFIMQWLGKIGKEKSGGGWFDPYGTSPPTYVEQARQTVLGQARNALLFCYGSLQDRQGAADVARLREEIPALFQLASLVHGKPIVGIHAPKPPNSRPKNEPFIFDFVGMLGLPLVPSADIDPDAKAAFFSQHALAAPTFPDKLKKMLADGKPVLITSHLAEDLKEVLAGEPRQLQILKVGDEPRDLYNLTREELDALRRPLLAPFGIEFSAPSRVALYLYGDDLAVIENFNDTPAQISLAKKGAASFSGIRLKPMDGGVSSELKGKVVHGTLVARSLLAVLWENRGHPLGRSWGQQAGLRPGASFQGLGVLVSGGRSAASADAASAKRR